MKIIAIESSCDETSVAFLNGKQVVDCLTWSQVDYHQKFGGVVPQIASKLHSDKLPILLNTILQKNQIIWKEIDLIAYTAKPGLVGCLKMGESMAKTIGLFHKITVLPINHLHAHIYAVNINKKIQFPALALIISGGHTQMFYMPKELIFHKIGDTLDDAVGETLDKIGRSLKLKYPAGSKIERLAKTGKWQYKFKIYNSQQNLNFSLSGLKTNAIRLIEKEGLGKIQINNFAYSIQKTIFQNIYKKIELAIKKYKVKNIILAGGVAANSELKKEITKTKLPVLCPLKKYCTDNAAMIGILAYYQIKEKQQKTIKID